MSAVDFRFDIDVDVEDGAKAADREAAASNTTNENFMVVD